MQSSERFVRILAVLALVFALCGIADAKTRKGNKLLAEGRKAEQVKEWDKALDLYEQALAEDPGELSYQIAARRVRFQAAEAHVGSGQRARNRGDLEIALGEFQKAYSMDPSSMIAEQELRRTIEMIERNKKDGDKGGQLAPEDRTLTPADLARKQMQDKLSLLQGPPELKPLSREPLSVKMTNQPAKFLFETVAKLGGINAVFDQDFVSADSGKRYSIDLQNSTLEDALDYLATYTKSYWKPLSANTIFVTQDNPQKRRELEDQVVKVFYLRNVTAPNDLQEYTSVIRTIIGGQQFKLFQYNGLNALIVRGTPDQVMLCEKLVNDMDKPKPEVVVDVLILEASRTKNRTLGATLATAGTPGLNLPILFTPQHPVTVPGSGGNSGGGSSSTSQLISLARIAHLSTNDFSITMPGALLQAVMTDTGTKILQSPQVRAVSGGKAVLKIGDKVPIASGGVQPFGGQVGGFSSLYSSFTFQDVGVNVDLSPVVNGDHEVTLKTVLEVSAVRDHVDIGGISQPIIGQRRVEFEMRLKEGEVNVIGGLMQSQEIKALSGIPGLMQIPILKRIFSSENLQKNESELLFALIPHIVRTPDITPLNLQTVGAGTETIIKMNMAPRPAVPGAEPAKDAAPAAAQPVPGGQPAPAEAKPAAPVEAKPAAPMRFTMQPEAINAQPNGTFSVELRVENAGDLFAAPFHLKFDPQYLQLAEVRPGAKFSEGGQTPIFTRNILNETGDATVNLNRTPGAGGVNGSGALATFLFKALKPGTTTVTFSEIGARNSQMQPVGAPLPQAAVTIK